MGSPAGPVLCRAGRAGGLRASQNHVSLLLEANKAVLQLAASLPCHLPVWGTDLRLARAIRDV